MAVSQVPTMLLSHHPSSSGYREKIQINNSWVEVRTKKLLTTTVTDKTDLGKMNVIYCQLITAQSSDN